MNSWRSASDGWSGFLFKLWQYCLVGIRIQVEAGAVTACVSVSKTESRNALDNLALCMRAFCAVDDLTGQFSIPYFP
jgi:hypothetical protein